MGKSNNKKIRLPGHKAVKEAVEVMKDFRACCKQRLETGYWATIDFPSKHHVNNLLQLQYRKMSELEAKYGLGLASLALETIPHCKAYLAFLRDEDKTDEVDKKRNKNRR